MDRHILTQNFTGQERIYLYSTIQLKKTIQNILPLCLFRGSLACRLPGQGKDSQLIYCNIK